MLVVVCPGQGSQTPGMLAPWLEIPEFRASIEAQQAASGVALIEHGTSSDADTIRDTAIAQPLIVASGVASMATLDLSGAAGFAGHSVGEITAAVASGVFSPEVGIKFVTERATQMAKAAKTEKTSMAAVLGGEQSVVEARLAELGLEPANYNGGGQIVAAGAADAIAALQAEGPAGAKVIPLQVAGAFHTRYMAEASTSLGHYVSSIAVGNPHKKLWTNAGGRLIDNGAEFVSLLVSQVKSPVRWDLCMQAMVAAGVTAILEVAPGGTLVGLAKRGMPGIESVALKSPENLDAAKELIKNHSN